ncbi:FAD binding domain-containing protein [Mangrovicella endophytica]|uniref:FAD binding domain-containing protein n=1 Tax=Mangrovicella endophytica TaxID=2066697 RepID=UPI000C9EB01E|nr:FAD binding domain-containing protein [Mangrovicella endophytica]
MLSYGTYLLPGTLKEALEAVATLPPGGRVLAGATDIVPYAREGRGGDVHLPVVVDLSRVAEFKGHQVGPGTVRLNASLVFQDFLEDATLREHLPCMPHCAIWFADDQVREQATLAGNIANASPAADGVPPLLAMNGMVELARLEGREVARRSLRLDDFIQGPGKSALAPGELITAVTVESMRGYGGSFQKVGQRRSLVISKVSAAALVKTDPSGTRFEDVRLAIGGVGPVPVRLTDIEAMLNGQPITRRLVAEAGAIPADRVASRSMVEYRKRVVSGFVAAAIEDALVACGAPMPTDADREEAHV